MSARRAKKTQKVRKSHEKLKKVLLLAVLLLCTAIVILIGITIGMYASAVKEIEAMNVQNLAVNYSSIIYYTDENGNAHEMENVYNNGNRIWIDSEEIPKVMKQAIVSIEDERFYEHGGVDIKRTAGAFFGWVKAKLTGGSTSYGGSTITQQVIKNITNKKNKTAMRKVKEMLLAVALERELTKDEILTVYLNLVCFANNCYGVEAASNIYYTKSASELTLNEAATIAGITQRPEYFNPLKNPENAQYKRDVILTKMAELGMISEDERDETMAMGLQLKDNSAAVKNSVYSYFVDTLLNEVIADLQEEKGYSEEMAEQMVYSGGLSIFSTADPSIQQKMENYFENSSNFPSISKQAQAAMIVLDPYTGEIKGVIGGLGKKTESRGLNRATQSRRQPGSSIKPLSVYGPAIEEDIINATSPVLDAEITVGDWSPKNAYSGYKGRMSVKRAVQISSNTAAVRVLQDLGISKSYSYLENKFSIGALSNNDKNLPALGLGGLTLGVTPKEMAAAYAVFANGGMYIEPYTYTKVVDNAGNVLLENKPKPKRVLRDSTAYIMTDILKDVVTQSSGTGKRAELDEMPAYGKTGTTNENKDKWFVGYTPYYVGAIWYGFDQPESLSKYGVSSSIAPKIWGEVMEKIHEGYTVKDFVAPDSVEKSGSNYFWVDSDLKKYSTSSTSTTTKKEPEKKDTEDTDDDNEETPTEGSDDTSITLPEGNEPSGSANETATPSTPAPEPAPERENDAPISLD